MDIRNTMNHSLFALLILTALIAGKSVDGYPAGGAQEGAGEEWAADAIEHGCYCHADVQINEGMYSLEGIPQKYVPEQTYNISLKINDTNVISEEGANRYGGFLSEVTEGAYQSNEDYWIGDDGSYISHNTNSNNVRDWTFQWTAPAEGTGDAVFTMYFNVVNGVGTNGDQWSYFTAISLGTPQAASEEVSIHELGVELMQYWIGLIGLAVVFLSIFVSYIVIRGGSAYYRG